MDSADIERLERLIAAAVTYRAACEDTSLGFMPAMIAVDNAANEVLAAAEAIRSTSRLTAYEAGVLTAAREVRHMGVVFQVSGPWHHPAQSALGRLVDAARQPEEAAE